MGENVKKTIDNCFSKRTTKIYNFWPDGAWRRPKKRYLKNKKSIVYTTLYEFTGADSGT